MSQIVPWVNTLCSYKATSFPSAAGVKRSITMVLDGRLPSNIRCGTSQSGVPSDLTCSRVFPKASASVCANTFASRISYAVFCLQKKKNKHHDQQSVNSYNQQVYAHHP